MKTLFAFLIVSALLIGCQAYNSLIGHPLHVLHQQHEDAEKAEKAAKQLSDEFILEHTKTYWTKDEQGRPVWNMDTVEPINSK